MFSLEETHLSFCNLPSILGIPVLLEMFLLIVIVGVFHLHNIALLFFFLGGGVEEEDVADLCKWHY